MRSGPMGGSGFDEERISVSPEYRPGYVRRLRICLEAA